MRFGGLIAIDDLSFSAARGEITAIIGPNGAGKTTVFNCITGFYKPSGGRVLLSLSDATPTADQIDRADGIGRAAHANPGREAVFARAHARLRDRRTRQAWPAPSKTSACLPA